MRTGYLYDAGRLIAEYNASGKVFAQYIHGSGLGGDVGSLLFAQKLTGSGEETSVETSYYFHNWRGDVVAVTDESGNPLDTYRYSAFGEVIEQSGASDNDILFSSKRYHDATALSYFGARYYDASIGRFISRDPLGYIDGPNGYIYVSNNPINLIDPLGLTARTSKGGTIQIGLNMSGGLAFGGAVEAGVTFGYSEEHGIQMGFYHTESVGSHIGKSGLVSLNLTSSENTDIKNLDGWSISTGGSGAYGLGYGIEGNIPIADSKDIKPSLTHSISGGIALETHVYGTHTKVYKPKFLQKIGINK